MPQYTVDVKAFISITVEAEDEADARTIADTYVEESLSPDEMEINAWNEVQETEEGPGTIIDAGSWDVDGMSEVEEA